MSRPIKFGEIRGIEEGHHFEGRKEMMPTSFHRRWGGGIDGNGKEGTAAIVLSGGYEDDEDLGDEIIYTGAGGRDQETGKQIEDQSWDNPGNAGLLICENKGLPVRVIRGFKHKSQWSPSSGYTYAGLYSVVESWEKKGKSGHKVCMYRLVYSGGNEKRKSPEETELGDSAHTTREKRKSKSTVLRTIRDSQLAYDVKDLYNFKCQMCGIVIETKKGRYAEGAHIKPIGKPHNGDDNANNLICLCPNHHVMFDRGVIAISDDLELIDKHGDIPDTTHSKLTLHSSHNINPENLLYHREMHGFNG
jgi:putative restriction endonuclease